MAELGQIERPAADSFSGKRKLYCVPSVFPVEDAPEEYRRLVDSYWDQAEEQIRKLENAGRVTKIFCEGIHKEGEEALGMLSAMNERANRVVAEKVAAGAALLPIEREDIVTPFLDWRNCLAVVRTQEVYERVLEFYRELLDRRLKYMVSVIDGNLFEGESGMLILGDDDRVRLQLPPDIEIFLVTPPSYDDLVRWVRQRLQELQGGGGQE